MHTENHLDNEGYAEEDFNNIPWKAENIPRGIIAFQSNHRPVDDDQQPKHNVNLAFSQSSMSFLREMDLRSENIAKYANATICQILEDSFSAVSALKKPSEKQKIDPT